MLSIRKVLESNGVLTRNDIMYCENEKYSTKDKQFKCFATGLDEAKEKLSRQYVIENGFKLEWLLENLEIDETFDKYINKVPINEFIENNYNISKMYKYVKLDKPFIHISLNFTKKNTLALIDFIPCDDKLIAWLYANDIKIVE
jgi:hypothetical protein